VQRDVARGTIAFWSGSIATIPLTWRLCDGTRFTPNLLNSFNVGAGDTYNPDDIAGEIIHDHPFTGDTHLHGVTGGTEIGAGLGRGIGTTDDPAIGTTDNGSSLPPYHALLPIMYDGRLR